MAKFEVTWDEYTPFMVSDDRRTKPGAKEYPDPNDTMVDMVSPEIIFGQVLSIMYP